MGLARSLWALSQSGLIVENGRKRAILPDAALTPNGCFSIIFAIRYMGRRRLQTERFCVENCCKRRFPEW